MILSIRSYFLRKRNIPYGLFLDALKNENSGHLEEAVTTYENALKEAEKVSFHSDLKNRITGKIKLLHTIIDYQNNLHFSRRATEG
jgi:hypothetical protein